MLLVVIMFLTIWWAVVRWKRKDTQIYLPKQLQLEHVPLPFIGHSYLFIGSQEDIMTMLKKMGRIAIERDEVVGFIHGSTPIIIVADPIAAEVIVKNCLEKGDVMNPTHLVTGNGSIFAPVSIWRPRRKTIAPTFSVKNLAMIVDNIFAKQSSILVKQLGKVKKGSPFSPWKYYTAYTMNSVYESTIGVPAQQNPNHPFLMALEEIFRIISVVIMKPWLYIPYIYTKLSWYRTLRKRTNFMYDLIDESIKSIKRSQEPQNADKEDSFKPFAELLIQSKNNSLSDVGVREECVVMMFAGTDTSAVGTAFTTVLLANHQAVQEKVLEELKEVFEDSTRLVKPDDLHRLKYLDAVIKETMRLYPPVPVTARKIDKDLELPSGVIVPKGYEALINIWATHRNPKYWGEDADEFRPERFFEPLKHPAAYMPFSYGPRGCLGYQYAMMSMKTVLATLLREYRVAPATDHEEHGELRVKFDLMMRHVGDYRVRMYPRK